MRRSLRSNVVTWLISNAPCSRKLSEFGVRLSAAVKPPAFLFSAVRLSMPFARLSDSVTRKTLKLFRKPRRSSLRYLRFLLFTFVSLSAALLHIGSAGLQSIKIQLCFHLLPRHTVFARIALDCTAELN